MRRLLLAAICAVLAGAEAATAGDATWLHIDAPPTAETTGPLPLIEVRGRAAARAARLHEIVIVIDASDSSLLASGWDVDGDGPKGRTDPAVLARLVAGPEAPAGLAERLRDADFDDSVLAAELAATRALLARLETSGEYRVGLVAFSDTARVLARVGSSPEELDAAMNALPGELSRYLRGTNFGDAITAAQLALQPDSAGAKPGPPAGVAQSILLLSDGVPTLPPHGDGARQHALYAAGAAGAAGIRIFSFDLSRERNEGPPVLAEIAARSGGRFERLERPGDAIAELRRTDLAGLAELRVVNATTGAPARALRTFPDGSFDGFVEVAPGRNRIEFRATTADGRTASAERFVVREGTAAPADVAALVGELRKRTRETEIWAQMEHERRTRRLDVDVQLETAPAPQVLPK